MYPCCEYYLKILIFFFKTDNHAASWTKSYEMETGADYYLLRSIQQLVTFRFALLIWKIENNDKRDLFPFFGGIYNTKKPRCTTRFLVDSRELRDYL